MKLIQYFAIVTYLTLMGWGCASGVTVRTNGFLGLHNEGPTLTPGSRIYIHNNPQAENPLFDQEIAGKIKRLLQSQGYVVSSKGDAQFVLEYSYAMDQGRMVTETVPEYRPGDIVHRSGRYRVDGKEGTYSEYETTDGYIAHVPVDTVVYTRKLTIKVTGKQGVSDQPVWIGESVSQGPKEDLREMIDYLLIGAFRSFAKDTQRSTRMVIPSNDKEILMLRGQ